MKNQTKWSKVDGPDSELEYDGKRIRFPDSYETNEPIKQAKRAADYLGRELSKALATNIPVRPIVCYPGWFVPDSPGEPWEVKVRNPQRLNNVPLCDFEWVSRQTLGKIDFALFFHPHKVT